MSEKLNEFFESFGMMTFSSDRFWTICSVVLAVILIYQLLTRFTPKAVAPLHNFLQRHPLVWILIPAALLIYFVYVSIGWNIWVSVSDWEAGELEASYGWGGFGQYTAMFGSNEFWRAVLKTLELFMIIPVCLLLGLGLALVMDQGLRGTTVFRTLILLPFALSFVVTGTVWAYVYRPTGGILNSVFGLGNNVQWAFSHDDATVMISIVIAMVWQFSGYVAVIFLAAIKNVPTNIINAAKLDGAYMPRIYWKMIIPQLKGSMGSCITILAMYALRSFDFIVSLVGYTKSQATTLPILMYNEAFQKNNFAYSAAISCFLLALVLVLILPLTYWTNKRK
ncbi:MAG: sugar ABC transporter permease [Clostridia bacterium]|nr:sugar ABC transporter permease [Clostridia bacterium]